MTIQDCIHFANENKVCYLATIDGDQPHVRALGFWFADKQVSIFKQQLLNIFHINWRKTLKLKCVFITTKE